MQQCRVERNVGAGTVMENMEQVQAVIRLVVGMPLRCVVVSGGILSSKSNVRYNGCCFIILVVTFKF